jgi:lactoylglutathione lyase
MKFAVQEGVDMVRIEHVALWTDDIDRLAEFYVRHFDARPGRKYVNAANRFESRFLSFASGARLELMRTTAFDPACHVPGAERMGLTHLALAVGSDADVDACAQRMQDAGIQVLDGPRRTGDGYYETVVLDPDGNRVEIVAS